MEQTFNSPIRPRVPSLKGRAGGGGGCMLEGIQVRAMYPTITVTMVSGWYHSRTGNSCINRVGISLYKRDQAERQHTIP